MGTISQTNGNSGARVRKRNTIELDAFKQGHYVCIEVGKLPYSIDLNYLRNLQEMSVTAVDDLMELKECRREEAFNIIQEWAKEFTKEYGNCDFDGSYYDEIDAFIEEKLRTI